MKYLRLIRNSFLFALSFFIVDRFCRLQTDGFSIAKIVPHHELETSAIQLSPELKHALDQPYYFLGSGVQCYAFISKDKQTVLKLFKHYHLFPGNNIAKLLPFPFLKRLIQKREERLQKIFKSCQIAYENLQEETGTLFVHFQKIACPNVTLVDRLGIKHLLNFSDIEFVLQKHANPMPFNANLEKLRKLNSAMARKGFKTKDTKIRNFAFIGEEPILIDIGSLTRMKNSDLEKREKKFEQKLAKWREKFEKTI